MKDTTTCPICQSKLYSINNALIHPQSNKKFQRQCRSGYNHYLLFYSDPDTNNINWMKIGLNPDYSVFAEIDFVNNMIIIRGYKASEENLKIVIPKIIDPDFPKLELLKEKIKMYVSFS